MPDITILTGVHLGTHTAVGAGDVVTKSFDEGYCVVSGNPARPIKTLDAADCAKHKSEHEYHGFIPAADFQRFRKTHLKL